MTVDDVMVLASMRKAQGFEGATVFRYEASTLHKQAAAGVFLRDTPAGRIPARMERCLNASLLSFCFLLRRTNKRC
jgi:hypothetical protein